MTKLAIVNLATLPHAKIPTEFIQSVEESLPEDMEFTVVERPAQLFSALSDATWILGHPFPKTFIKRNKRLKGVFFVSSQTPDLSDSDILVQDIKGLNARSVAQHAREFALKFLEKHELDPKNLTVGVMGQGHIGEMIPEIFKDIFPNIQTISRASGADFTYDDYSDFLNSSDIIIPALELNAQTKELFRPENFYKNLKEDVCIINIARGELFIESELISFLNQNPKATYLTDVTYPEPYPEDGPLRQSDQVVITNHIAGFRNDIWGDVLDKWSKVSDQWFKMT
ncbi:MAG: hypothetical protein KC478_06675 [Bacteriovoracaceae bacterium]|nr:hypothetical protein [Bacteriovoracaceae bacterium]